MLKSFWLFQRGTASLPLKKQKLFWAWNTLLVLLSGICLGCLSLIFAFGHYQVLLFRSYFTHPLILLLNLLPVVMLELLLWLLTGRSWLSFLLTGILTLGFSIGHYYKLLFRDDPLMFQDLQYLREAGSIAQAANYDLTPDKRVVTGIACLILGTAFLFLLARGIPRLRLRLLLSLMLVLLCVPVGAVYANDEIYAVTTRNFDYINRWSSTQLYISKGFVYPFLHSAFSGTEKAPEGYSSARAEALLEPYADADIPEDRKADIIAIQLEAFADFSRFGAVPGVDWEKAYSTYHTLEEESYTGDLITNIFAGGTVDTERCVLTGHARLKEFRAPSNSYAWYLRSQGYAAEGSHPSYQWFYNRRNVNEYLGFSTYYYMENHYPQTADGVVRDADLFPEIYSLYAANRDGTSQPYFSFNVTYQGHGPYSAEVNRWGGDYTDGRYSLESTNILNNYLGSVADTAEQLAALLDRFRQEERPVVVMVFGDHKPWLGDGNSVYQELGIDLDISTEQGFRNYYATRYLIWANDAAKASFDNDFTGCGPDISACFLMNQVFALCGWEGSAWIQAMSGIMAELPVVTEVGWYGENGTMTQLLSTSGEEALEKLRYLEYYDSRHFSH